MPEIRLEKIEKSFPRGAGSRDARHKALPAVAELSLTISDGEFFTFVGPSGSGKSTVLNIIAGLERESGGSLYFNRRQVNQLEPKDRDIAMVFQSYALYPHLSIFENIAFPLRIRKRSRTQIDQVVNEIAAVLGLVDLLDRRPKELSGGQRQRVALARALVRKPKIFLMDEPLSNLDARLRLEMRGEIKRMHQSYGVTTIYVTHDQEEAMVLSDRIAVLKGGQLQQCAPPLELYEQPGNRFVAEFIGSPPINIIEGHEFSKAHNADSLLGGAEWSRVLCGLRPADIEACRDDGSRSPGNIELAGTVQFVELTGSEIWADVQWQQNKIRAKVKRDEPVKCGDQARISINPLRVHLFEGESERRVARKARSTGQS